MYGGTGLLAKCHTTNSKRNRKMDNELYPYILPNHKDDSHDEIRRYPVNDCDDCNERRSVGDGSNTTIQAIKANATI